MRVRVSCATVEDGVRRRGAERQHRGAPSAKTETTSAPTVSFNRSTSHAHGPETHLEIRDETNLLSRLWSVPKDVGLEY